MSVVEYCHRIGGKIDSGRRKLRIRQSCVHALKHRISLGKQQFCK